jgi:ABC-type Zn2+ transport system substrate-binding protein/surface adhesin
MRQQTPPKSSKKVLLKLENDPGVIRRYTGETSKRKEQNAKHEAHIHAHTHAHTQREKERHNHLFSTVGLEKVQTQEKGLAKRCKPTQKNICM